MESKFKLLKQAVALDNQQTERNNNIINALDILSEQSTSQQLAEAITHLLANIATTAAEGKPLKLMHLDSIAALMAGVDRISQALPSSDDPVKKQNTIRVLTAATVGPDGFVTTATAPIAQLGTRFPSLRQKYAQLVQNYVSTQSRGQPDGQPLAQAAKSLQQSIDSAMRSATTAQAVQQQ